jgi:hypothetical protein
VSVFAKTEVSRALQRDASRADMPDFDNQLNSPP